jgi:hypothetical protein
MKRMNDFDTLIREIIEMSRPDKIKAAFDALVKHDYADYLCLYGCGNQAKFNISLFERHNIKIDFLCESDGGANIGKTICGCKVISFSDLCDVKSRTLVIPSHGDYQECYALLAENGFPYVCHCCSSFVLDLSEILIRGGGTTLKKTYTS